MNVIICTCICVCVYESIIHYWEP
uniref:Uncharacterized protein n=1 Tax=Lepeophtheirus salmonis TaxID=72036 RepID=A0A0K2V904_LEPSM